MTVEDWDQVINVIKSVDAPELSAEFVNGWYKAQSAIIEALEVAIQVEVNK